MKMKTMERERMRLWERSSVTREVCLDTAVHAHGKILS
jgi:hypothetical protein